MTYPMILRKALVAVQNSAAAISPALFGLKSGATVLASAHLSAADGSDALIGGIGSTVATAMMLLA